MWNIIIGLVFLIGGLSGKLALRGTGSGIALAAIGGALMIWGIFQIFRSKKAGDDGPPSPPSGSPPAST